jgi:hypothetical protein
MIRITSLTRGDAIKNVKVIPRGIPASRKPIKTGTAEHEQKGVMTPAIPASALAGSNGNFLILFLIPDNESHDLNKDIRKITMISNRNILMPVVSKNVKAFVNVESPGTEINL